MEDNSNRELTVEQKAKLYDALKDENQGLRLMVCKMLDDFRNLCYNGIHRKFKTREGNEVEIFGKDLSQIAEDLRQCDGGLAWELSSTLKDLDKFGAHFDKVGEKGPIEARTLTQDVLDCKKMAEEVAHHNDLASHGYDTIDKFRKDFTASDEELTYKAILFYYEYRFGHVYPGDENSIYQDAYRCIMLPLMARVGCLPDKDSMLKWIGAYQEKHKSDK